MIELALHIKRTIRSWIFPLVVGVVYAALYTYNSQSTVRAFDVSCSILKQMILPVCFVICMMTALNRVLSPAIVTRFLGQKTGIKGVLLSALAGILSMGPLYAWYPLFKSLKEQGASTFIIANFISCRSVKPVLFPVLFAYFGWDFTFLFVGICLVGALMTAYIVTFLSFYKVSRIV